jgi:hypothetical protein
MKPHYKIRLQPDNSFILVYMDQPNYFLKVFTKGKHKPYIIHIIDEK